MSSQSLLCAFFTHSIRWSFCYSLFSFVDCWCVAFRRGKSERKKANIEIEYWKDQRTFINSFLCALLILTICESRSFTNVCLTLINKPIDKLNAYKLIAMTFALSVLLLFAFTLRSFLEFRRWITQEKKRMRNFQHFDANRFIFFSIDWNWQKSINYHQFIVRSPRHTQFGKFDWRQSNKIALNIFSSFFFSFAGFQSAWIFIKIVTCIIYSKNAFPMYQYI